MTQLIRLYHKCWRKMVDVNPLLAFGWDAPTLWEIYPGWMAVRDAIRTEGCRRLHS